MIEIWVAFIITCSTQEKCDGPKTYGKSDSLYMSEESCVSHARTWAIFAHAETGKDFAYGCERNTYEPKQIKP